MTDDHPDIENQSVFGDKPKPEHPSDRQEMMRVHDALYEICYKSKLSPGMLYGTLFALMAEIAHQTHALEDQAEADE